MNILFATGNKNKLREAREILGDEFVLSTPADLGITEDIPETSDTIKGNAIQKAQYLWEHTGKDCFADDTGLEVDYLHGAPGVYSARYAGESKILYGIQRLHISRLFRQKVRRSFKIRCERRADDRYNRP